MSAGWTELFLCLLAVLAFLSCGAALYAERCWHHAKAAATLAAAAAKVAKEAAGIIDEPSGAPPAMLGTRGAPEHHRCRHCGELIEQRPSSRKWAHTRTYIARCQDIAGGLLPTSAEPLPPGWDEQLHQAADVAAPRLGGDWLDHLKNPGVTAGESDG